MFKLDGKEKSVIYYDAIFAKAIDMLNANSVKTGKPIIMLSNGKKIYAEATAEFKAASNEEKAAKGVHNFVLDVFDKHISEAYGEPTNWCHWVDTKFGNNLKANINSAASNPDMPIPLSPYANRYPSLIARNIEGNRLFMIRSHKNLSMSDLTMPGTYEDVDYVVSNMDYFSGNYDTTKINDKHVKPAYESADKYGLAEFMPYAKKEDFAKIAESVREYCDNNKDALTLKLTDIDTKGLSDDKLSAAYDKMYAKVRDNVSVGLSVIKALNELGYDYDVIPDKLSGQAKVNVPEANCIFRIIDVNEPEFTGRYYSNGVSGYIAPSYKANFTENKYPELKFEPTKRDVYDFVRFALGETVYTQPFMPGRDVLPIKDKPEFTSAIYPVGQIFSFDRDSRVKNVVKHTRFLSAYHIKDGSSSYVYRNQHNNPNDDDFSSKFGHKVSFRFDGSTFTKGVSPIVDIDTARTYINDCVTTAKANIVSELNSDDFMMEMYDGKDDPNFEPVYSEDKVIANIQKTYYDYYVGKIDKLPRLDANYEKYMQYVEAGEPVPMGLEELAFFPDTGSDYEERLYHIEEHAKMLPEHLIGSLTPDANGKTINLAMIARFQQSEMGVSDFIDSFSDALRYLDSEIDVSQFKSFGNDYSDNIVNKSVAFDEESAVDLETVNRSEFIDHVYKTVKDGILYNGGGGKIKILMDKNGIIKYNFDFSKSSLKELSAKDSNGNQSVAYDYDIVKGATGYLGQIFEPDKDGLVETKYKSGNNLIFAPGYNATVLPHIDGDGKSVEERTRLMGYEQTLLRNIKQQMRHDMVSAGFTYSKGKLGSPTNISYTYKQLYTRRYDLDFKEKFREQGMSEEDLAAIVKTEMQKVRYPTKFKNDATIYAAINAEKRPNFSDSEKSYFNLVDRRNMGMLDERSDGYFDPIMTTATSTNQGIVRYLVDGAKVNPDGSITKSEVPNDRCGVMHTDWAKYMSYDPFDRQNMSSSNIAKASAISKPVGVAQMTFNGYNFEDAVIISKEFASAYKMRTEDGSLRPLKKGDKISDMHGNKGVVSLIIDRGMDELTAENLGIKDAVSVFKNNAELDVVMAPFSAVGRFNGGTARELMSNIKDLVDHKGDVHEAGIGHMRFIVTDKSAEAKTHIYASDNEFDDTGRKASSQLAWILNSKNCKAIMRELYGPNNTAVRDLREYLIASGLDLSNKGDILTDYTPQEGEVRKVFPMPHYKDVTDAHVMKRANGTSSYKRPKGLPEDFKKNLMLSGGMMELPFPLKFPSSDADSPKTTSPVDALYDRSKVSVSGYTKRNGTVVAPYTRQAVASESDTYLLPILSSKLRAGLEFDDGDVSVHDYTQKYTDIAMQGYMYTYYDYLEKNNINMSGINPTAEKERCKINAQSSYDQIVNDISNKKLQGKHNVIKESIMSRRINKSATAIVTPDPKLRIDEVGVSPELLKKLGKKNGDHILFFRDPLLRNGGVAYLKAVEQPDITGVAINPVRFKPMDGDYDGGARRSIMKSYRAA